ncbi:MAG: class I SAM-dependent methyltransferase [Anaerolineae bacterium]|nr:class I SAM-dependent methyltransferase [Anaerolineae bacterium]
MSEPSLFTDQDPLARWDDMKIYGPYARTLTRWIHKLLDPLVFSSVLDVGCGRGHTLQRLIQRYPQIERVAGIDLSPISLQDARERVGQGDYYVMDIQTSALSEQFDLVICTDVIELLLHDTQALNNMRKMTAKYLLVTSLQGNFLPEWEVRISHHVRNYRRGELAAKMREAGFNIQCCVEWGFPFYSPLYRRSLNLFQGQGMDGHYGLGRKLLSEAIFRLFYLNTARRGELIFVVGTPAN